MGNSVGRDVARKGDVTVKLNGDVVRVAKIVAAYRGISLAEYLSGRLDPIVQSDLDREQEHARARKGKIPKG